MSYIELTRLNTDNGVFLMHGIYFCAILCTPLIKNQFSCADFYTTPTVVQNTLVISYLLFRSPTLYRAFYIPFLSNKHNVYANYTLLKSKSWKEEKRKYKTTDFEYDDPDEFEGID